MTRRTFAALLAAAAAAAPRSRFGIGTTCFLTARRPNDAVPFADYGASLNAAGVQAPMTSTDAAYVKQLRGKCEQHGLYYEAMVTLPKEDSDAFAQRLRAAKEAGARCARIGALSGRRYETFKTKEDWDRFVTQSKQSIRWAVKAAERERLPLALENHKDWTIDEHVALLQSYDSEWLGALVDTGNNLSLLDDPYEVVERLAPYAVSTHIKDMGVEEFPDGFLLSEVVIGQGFLDLPRIIATLQRARPQTPLTLEMITRDPLKVPCLTDAYWTTMPDRSGRYLARTLALVRSKGQKLPRTSGLSKDDLLREEERNVVACLRA